MGLRQTIIGKLVFKTYEYNDRINTIKCGINGETIRYRDIVAVEPTSGDIICEECAEKLIATLRAEEKLKNGTLRTGDTTTAQDSEAPEADV